jgi:hypothetical protein
MRISFKAALWAASCAAFCGAIFTITPHARATPVYTITNLDQSDAGTSDTSIEGQSIMTGSTATIFTSFTTFDPFFPTAPILNIDTRNADGTLGTTLDTISGAGASYDTNTGLLTFTAPTSFTLAANTGYWFVINDPGHPFGWDYTDSTSYTSQFGFSLPAADDYVFGVGLSDLNYDTLSSGPYLFGLVTSPAPAAPEPGTFAMAALALPALGFWAWKKRNETAT